MRSSSRWERFLNDTELTSRHSSTSRSGLNTHRECLRGNRRILRSEICPTSEESIRAANSAPCGTPSSISLSISTNAPKTPRALDEARALPSSGLFGEEKPVMAREKTLKPWAREKTGGNKGQGIGYKDGTLKFGQVTGRTHQSERQNELDILTR